MYLWYFACSTQRGPGLARLADTSYDSSWVPSYPWSGITALLLNTNFSITLTYKILCLKFSSSDSAEYVAEYDQDSHHLPGIISDILDTRDNL